MAEKLTDELKHILTAPDTLAVISAVGKDGNPYSQVPHKIGLWEDGRISVHQLLEKSLLQKNLVYSLWFDRQVSLVLAAKDGSSYHLYLKPYQALVAGREFTREYQQVLSEFGPDSDLSTVWLFDVEAVASASYRDERAKEREEHPYLYHLDHIVKEEYRA
ncbi:MAG: hypothetical protein K6G80_04570 [Treponema sp.]|nr:hypothetical protein [Treponema sp.]